MYCPVFSYLFSRTNSDRGPGQQASPMEQIIQEFVNNLTGGMNLENLDEEGAGPM